MRTPMDLPLHHDCQACIQVRSHSRSACLPRRLHECVLRPYPLNPPSPTRHRMNVCLGPHPSRLLPASSEQRHHHRGFGKRSHNLIGYGGRRSNFVRRYSHRLRRAVRRAFQGEHTVSIRVWVARSETHRNLTGLSRQRTDLQTVYGVCPRFLIWRKPMSMATI